MNPRPAGRLFRVRKLTSSDWQADVTSGSRIDSPLLPIGHPVLAPEGLCRVDLPGRDALSGLSRGAGAWYCALTAWFASTTQLPTVLDVTVPPETEHTGELPGLNVTGLPDPPSGAAIAPGGGTGVNATGCDTKAGLSCVVPVTAGPVPAPVVTAGQGDNGPDPGAPAKRR
jgi:hypothetical protein